MTPVRYSKTGGPPCGPEAVASAATPAGSISGALRHWWLRTRQFSGGAATLSALYAKPDPWNFAGYDEQVRFVATNALITAYCPERQSLLEIGCGEGFQTRHLCRIAPTITGIDVSGRALTRARAALSGPTFLEGTLASQRPNLPQPRYDVVTLCEVLVYVDDPAQLIADAQHCANVLFVSNFEPQSRSLAPLFRGEGWQALPPIESGRKRWKPYLWRRPLTPHPA